MRATGPLHLPTFRRWATADAISLLGTAVSLIVLPILVYDHTGSTFLTGLIAGVRVVPCLLVGLVAGPVADRLDRRRLLVAGNLAQGAFLAVIPLSAIGGEPPIPVVFAMALLAATCFVFADAAAFGALPAIVGRDALAAANGFLGGIQAAAAIAGPALGGVLATTIGTAPAIWVDVGSFVLAAGLVATIRYDDDRAGAARVSLREHSRRALRFIRGHRVVATLIVSGFGNSFAFGGVVALLVPFAVERLGSAEDGPAVAALFVADALGALVAATLFARIYDVRRIRWLSPACMAVSTAGTAGLAATDRVGLALVLVAVASAASAVTISTGITYRQQAAPPALTASVNVVGRMVAWGGSPIGAAACGFVAERGSVGTGVALAAVAVGIAALGAAASLGYAGSTPGT